MTVTAADRFAMRCAAHEAAATAPPLPVAAVEMLRANGFVQVAAALRSDLHPCPGCGRPTVTDPCSECSARALLTLSAYEVVAPDGTVVDTETTLPTAQARADYWQRRTGLLHTVRAAS